jgi:hypothetical protein
VTSVSLAPHVRYAMLGLLGISANSVQPIDLVSSVKHASLASMVRVMKIALDQVCVNVNRVISEKRAQSRWTPLCAKSSYSSTIPSSSLVCASLYW